MLRHTGDILRITLSDIQQISYARISLGRAAKDNRLIWRRYPGVIRRAMSATYLICLCVEVKVLCFMIERSGGQLDYVDETV